MQVQRLWLTDFRCYESVELALPPDVIAIVGANGEGKTTLLEAVAWIATARSFRGVPDAALVRSGAEQAVVRAEIVDESGREQLFEAEIRASGRNRVLLNRKHMVRRRDLLGLVRVTVFAPDDLALVKGGPAERREYLDDLLVASAPRYDAARGDYDRVLRQRNALLRGWRGDAEDDATLMVFDAQLAAAGAELVRGRLRLVEQLLPRLRSAYGALAGPGEEVAGSYEAGWAEGTLSPGANGLESMLQVALVARRRPEIERRMTLVGPHRDDWRLMLNGLDVRTRASQGEQRTLALALRLGGHAVVREIVGEDPVLLLDDVFSELDPARARALVANLPRGQTLVTSAGVLPPGITATQWLRVAAGRIEVVEP